MALEVREIKKTYTANSDTRNKKKGNRDPRRSGEWDDFSISLDFKVDEGETLALLGPSGSGKTTAINLISGLSKPDSGKVFIDGEDLSDLPSWKRNISLVFQDLALFPHLDVGGNIAYGLFIRHVPKKERRRIIEETLKTVRLPGYASRRINTLSGGERQRVALARSLATSPRALLLDEPFSSLDLPLRKEMRREFLEIRSHSKASCIFVTHDREEAVMLGDKIALMDKGRIIETGTGRDLFLAPKTEFAARFFDAGVILPLAALPGTALPASLISNSPSGHKVFIPHDAISLQKPGKPGWVVLNLRCANSFFNGPNLVVKLFLPDAENTVRQEELSFEIFAGPRVAPPDPGSNLALWIDQSLLRFVS